MNCLQLLCALFAGRSVSYIRGFECNSALSSADYRSGERLVSGVGFLSAFARVTREKTVIARFACTGFGIRIHPEDVEAFVQRVENNLDGGAMFTVALPISSVNGSTV